MKNFNNFKRMYTPYILWYVHVAWQLDFAGNEVGTWTLPKPIRQGTNLFRRIGYLDLNLWTTVKLQTRQRAAQMGRWWLQVTVAASCLVLGDREAACEEPDIPWESLPLWCPVWLRESYQEQHTTEILVPVQGWCIPQLKSPHWCSWFLFWILTSPYGTGKLCNS